MAPPLRICMLNADVPVPTVYEHRATTYGRIFHQLLANASPNVTIQSTDFDVMQQHYPEDIEDFDAIVVSGSANSAYDEFPWIHRLDAYIQGVYANHPRVKIFGSCFGHQLVCQSVLGAKVEKDPKGWEIGVKEIALHEGFREFLGVRDETMRLQFVHHDHVVISTLPENWRTVGSTEHCVVQGVYEPGRVLTLQGHFEFDRFVNSECIKYFFGKEWEAERLDKALEDIDMDDDSVVAARTIVKFLLERGEAMEEQEEVVRHEVVGGLLVPPMEA